MATSDTTSIQSTLLLPEAGLDAVSRCVGDHAQALLMILAGAGDAWDASPTERRLLQQLVADGDVPDQQVASQ